MLLDMYNSFLSTFVWVCILSSRTAESQTILRLCHFYHIRQCICFVFLVSRLLWVIGSPPDNLVWLQSCTLNTKESPLMVK